MKEGYTAREIAEALGVTKRAVIKRAVSEDWSFREETARGGRRRLYLFDRLPAAVQAALIKVEDAPAEGSGTSAFAAASPEEQLVALARAELVEAIYKKVEALSRGSRRARTRALDRALEAYAARAWRPTVPAPDGGEREILALLGPVSRPTLYRWKKTFEAAGLDALLPARRSRPRAIPEDIRIEIERMIWERPRPSRKIYQYLLVAFSNRKDLPSYHTVHRYVSDYKREHREALTLAHKGEGAWRHSFQPALGSASAQARRPNDLWEIDTTPADVMTKDGRRHKVIGLIDVCSRRAVARLFPTSNGWGIAQTLRAGILKLGIPCAIRMDNGRDYQSRLVQEICRELSIETPRLPFRAPEKKPHIERFFRTLSEGLFAELTGYTGSSLLNRPETIRVNYTAEELQEIINRWIDNVYEETVHRSLGRRPREAYQVPGFQPRVIRDERQLDLLLMPARSHVVRKGAIRRVLHGQELIYFHEKLLALNGKRVDIKLDMADAGRIYVFHNRHFVCEAVDVVASGIPYQELIAHAKRHKKAIKERVRAERRLAHSGPIDRRLHELIAAKEAERPAIFLGRTEVVELEKYRPAVEGTPPAANSTEHGDPPSAAPLAGSTDCAVLNIRKRTTVQAFPERPPDPENEPLFWEDGDPFFLDGWKKWIWCHVHMLWEGKELSPRTLQWMEEYKKTDEYRFFFVENDFLAVYRWKERKFMEQQGGGAR